MTSICLVLTRSTISTDGILILTVQVYVSACDVRRPVNERLLVITVLSIEVVTKTPPSSCPLELVHPKDGTTNKYSSTVTVQVRVSDWPEKILREWGLMITTGIGRAVGITRFCQVLTCQVDCWLSINVRS